MVKEQDEEEKEEEEEGGKGLGEKRWGAVR